MGGASSPSSPEAAVARGPAESRPAQPRAPIFLWIVVPFPQPDPAFQPERSLNPPLSSTCLAQVPTRRNPHANWLTATQGVALLRTPLAPGAQTPLESLGSAKL